MEVAKYYYSGSKHSDDVDEFIFIDVDSIGAFLKIKFQDNS